MSANRPGIYIDDETTRCVERYFTNYGIYGFRLGFITGVGVWLDCLTILNDKPFLPGVLECYN